MRPWHILKLSQHRMRYRLASWTNDPIALGGGLNFITIRQSLTASCVTLNTFNISIRSTKYVSSHGAKDRVVNKSRVILMPMYHIYLRRHQQQTKCYNEIFRNSKFCKEEEQNWGREWLAGWQKKASLLSD